MCPLRIARAPCLRAPFVCGRCDVRFGRGVQRPRLRRQGGPDYRCPPPSRCPSPTRRVLTAHPIACTCTVCACRPVGSRRTTCSSVVPSRLSGHPPHPPPSSGPRRRNALPRPAGAPQADWRSVHRSQVRTGAVAVHGCPSASMAYHRTLQLPRALHRPRPRPCPRPLLFSLLGHVSA